ncbi:MAG: TPM domain-containing protein [Bacteroidales bacterium]|mgnify:FL=1|nr:TPM domain-containing protein [Bacteroidales bacterium]
MRNKFLTDSQITAVEQAIGQAEKKTSGEIRVRLEPRCLSNPVKRAVKVFYKLGMDKTKNQTGVLVYVAHKSGKIAIVGDKGINEAVGEGFWNGIIANLSTSFSCGERQKGLCDAVLAVGEALKQYFPYQDDDENELPNEISVGRL